MKDDMTNIQINDPTRDRYHALSISSVWDLDVVRQAKALVIGAGALGNEVAKNLAMMGVKLIAILDRDTVEVANLSRSVFFRESDHGRPKTEVLAERLKALNPDVEIMTLNGDVDAILGLGLVRRMDMIFSCLDSRLARRTVNRLCQKMAKPWVDGAMENLIGDVSVYMPDEGPCYECNFTQVDREIIAQAVSCKWIAQKNIALGKVPTTSTMGSIIAAIEVQEAIKILHGQFKGSLAGKRLVVNCGINDFYTTKAERKVDCDGHFRYGDVIEVPEWRAENISARDVLTRFEAETGQKGHINLGRDIVIAVQCSQCSTTEELGEPLRSVSAEKATCPECGGFRDAKLTHVIRETDFYVDWPLSRLGVPSLDILEVRGKDNILWFEMTGDTKIFPSGLA